MIIGELMAVGETVVPFGVVGECINGELGGSVQVIRGSLTQPQLVFGSAVDDYESWLDGHYEACWQGRPGIARGGPLPRYFGPSVRVEGEAKDFAFEALGTVLRFKSRALKSLTRLLGSAQKGNQ